MLIVVGGLPGTGKTTISRRLALAAAHLRIDLIEQVIRDSGALRGAVGASGSAVAQGPRGREPERRADRRGRLRQPGRRQP